MQTVGPGFFYYYLESSLRILLSNGAALALRALKQCCFQFIT